MVTDADPGGGPPQSNANTKRWGGVNSLGQMAKTGMFPTPAASTYGSNQGGARGRVGPVRHSLEGMARKNLWPTPKVARGDYTYDRGDHSKARPTLSGAVKIPTPTSSMMTTADLEQARYAGNDPRRPKYGEAAKMLPTPTVADAEGGRTTNGKDRPNEGGLQQAAQFWPTPTARDWRSGKASQDTMNKNARPLNERVEMWPTPKSSPDGMYVDNSPNVGTRDGARMGLASAVGRQNIQTAVGGQLNPDWVEWLMGVPIGWTSLDPLPQGNYDAWAQLATSSWWDEEPEIPRVAAGIPATGSCRRS